MIKKKKKTVYRRVRQNKSVTMMMTWTAWKSFTTRPGLFRVQPLDGLKCRLANRNTRDSNLIFDNTAVHLYVGYAFSARLVPFCLHGKKMNTTNRQIITNLWDSIQIENKVQIFHSREDSVDLNDKSKKLKCWHENTLLCQLYKLVTVPQEHTYYLRR